MDEARLAWGHVCGGGTEPRLELAARRLEARLPGREIAQRPQRGLEVVGIASARQHLQSPFRKQRGASRASPVESAENLRKRAARRGSDISQAGGGSATRRLDCKEPALGVDGE